MLKWIRNFFMKQELQNLKEQEDRIEEMRAKLVHRPLLSEIPDKLDQCEKLGKQLKKIKKRKKEINNKLGA